MVIFLWAFEIAEQQRGTVLKSLERKKMEEFKNELFRQSEQKINSQFFYHTGGQSITTTSKACVD